MTIFICDTCGYEEDFDEDPDELIECTEDDCYGVMSCYDPEDLD